MIIVFGSINMDMSLKVDKLPVPGETVLTNEYVLYPGGKGANQALAAVRAGKGKVALIGRVGEDNYGKVATDGVKRDGVMTSGVAKSTFPTGCAVATRDSHGDKQILVMSGANADADHTQVPDEILIPGNVLLMQMELPVDQTVALLERAKARGLKTILNLAPAIMVPKKAMGLLDYLIVNSIEARQIAEKLHLSAENNAIKIAHALAIQGQLTCVVTLGKRGSVAVTKEGKAWGVPILEVDQSEIVDNIGAGDAFCGTFTAAIHDGLDVIEAMRRASVAGTLACMKEGAQAALPHLDDIEARLSELGPTQDVKL
jgi:ribokinase